MPCRYCPQQGRHERGRGNRKHLNSKTSPVLAQRILNDPRAVRRATVVDGHPGHLHRPGDLDGELAAVPADRMADRIRAQLDGNAHQIIACGARWQQRLQPAPQGTDLSIVARKFPPPSQRRRPYLRTPVSVCAFAAHHETVQLRSSHTVHDVAKCCANSAHPEP
jgi:hypothetical protein